jgi:uncharacterized protein (TIGR02118 family)
MIRKSMTSDLTRGAELRRPIVAKMVVIYNTPKDAVAFKKHYFDIHVPLAKQLPGLKQYRVSRAPIAGRSTGDKPYMVATLYFDTMEDIKAAFSSDIGKACADDRRLFAPDDDDLAMLLFDEEEI